MWSDLPPVGELAWPVVIALAWWLGELGQRWKIPRVSTYGVVGFACGRAMPGSMPLVSSPGGSLLASVALGLILVEFGYRIRPHRLLAKPWLAATGVLDVALTFVAVYALCRVLGAAPISASLIGTIAAASSPATLMRIVSDLRSSGEVTDRALNLTAFNCLCALLAFKFIVGFWTLETSGEALKALSNGAVVLLVSAALGAAFGTGMPLVLRLSARTGADPPLAFVVAVVLLVGVTHFLRFSPLVACLAFGLLARDRGVPLEQAHRNSFGVLGDLLVVFLFTYVAAAVDWQRAVTGAALGTALVLVRAAAKVVALTLLARLSGATRKQGMLTALAMSPLSPFIVLLVGETQVVGLDLLDAMAPLAAATLLLHLVGPLAAQLALVSAAEVPRLRAAAGGHAVPGA